MIQQVEGISLLVDWLADFNLKNRPIGNKMGYRQQRELFESKIKTVILPILYELSTEMAEFLKAIVNNSGCGQYFITVIGVFEIILMWFPGEDGGAVVIDICGQIKQYSGSIETIMNIAAEELKKRNETFLTDLPKYIEYAESCLDPDDSDDWQRANHRVQYVCAVKNALRPLPIPINMAIFFEFAPDNLFFGITYKKTN